MSTITKQQLQKQLLAHFGNKVVLKDFAENCRYFDFPLGDNIDKLASNMEAFNTLITWQDLGILPKLVETLKTIKSS